MASLAINAHSLDTAMLRMFKAPSRVDDELTKHTATPSVGCMPSLCAGNAHSFDTTMPRMLKALSRAEADLTKHTIVTAIGFTGWRLCESLSGHYENHCALDRNMPGSDDHQAYSSPG